MQLWTWFCFLTHLVLNEQKYEIARTHQIKIRWRKNSWNTKQAMSKTKVVLSHSQSLVTTIYAGRKNVTPLGYLKTEPALAKNKLVITSLPTAWKVSVFFGRRYPFLTMPIALPLIHRSIDLLPIWPSCPTSTQCFCYKSFGNGGCLKVPCSTSAERVRNSGGCVSICQTPTHHPPSPVNLWLKSHSEEEDCLQLSDTHYLIPPRIQMKRASFRIQRTLDEILDQNRTRVQRFTI